MRRNLSFWRNVGIIGVVHGAVLFGLARWGGETKKATAAEIVWLDAGAFASVEPPAVIPGPPTIPAPAPFEEEPTVPAATEEAEPIVQPITSELPVPTPTPTTTATPSATPKLSPTPERKASPKPSPKVKPTVTPKKTLLAKAASPKPKPKSTPSQQKSPSSSSAPDAQNAAATKPTVTVKTASGAGTGDAAGGGSSSSTSEFAWYYRMLRERFSGEWEQPTSVVATGAKMSAMVRIRLEPDGRVSEFSIARSSGNVIVDESITEIAKRVTKVDPLPGGVGNGGSHEVTIEFGLNADQ